MSVLPSDPQMYALHFIGDRPWPTDILEGLPEGRGAVFHFGRPDLWSEAPPGPLQACTKFESLSNLRLQILTMMR